MKLPATREAVLHMALVHTHTRSWKHTHAHAYMHMPTQHAPVAYTATQAYTHTSIHTSTHTHRKVIGCRDRGTEQGGV